jgi:coatomer protein complex subunit gamma
VFRGGFEVLVRAKLALSDGVTMQVTVRAENPDISEDISELITSTIG